MLSQTEFETAITDAVEALGASIEEPFVRSRTKSGCGAWAYSIGLGLSNIDLLHVRDMIQPSIQKAAGFTTQALDIIGDVDSKDYGKAYILVRHIHLKT
jgi:hypothetical protein